ncbi:glycine zipper 2TM domain-containing protein [Hydrogenophaga sp. OTU3427]|uniref:glycine zipper 2TM domain-containing protein n=1 Tax=Hydrogenophaga sp. OTU3427 TaxID=3043856 RepID=UPI00313BFA82
MKHHLRLITAITALALLSTLSGCSNLSRRQQNAAIGAGVGAIGGSILTGGSTLGTLGGAAIGGVIGHGADSGRGGR